MRVISKSSLRFACQVGAERIQRAWLESHLKGDHASSEINFVQDESANRNSPPDTFLRLMACIRPTKAGAILYKGTLDLHTKCCKETTLGQIKIQAVVQQFVD
jgi:hypothetical protein